MINERETGKRFESAINRKTSPVYKRRRAAVASGLAAVMAAVIYGGGRIVESNDNQARKGSTEKTCPTVVVRPGDTPWEIARRADPKGDPRPVVDRIIRQEDPVLHASSFKLPC